MITNRYDFKYSENGVINVIPVKGKPQTFEFNVMIPQKMEVFGEKVTDLVKD